MTKEPKWLQGKITSIPKLAGAKKLAKLVYDSCNLEGLDCEDAMKRIYELGQFDFKYGRIISTAQLIHRQDNRFEIIVDREKITRRKDWRLKTSLEIIYDSLHEVGHSFFYYRKERETPIRHDEDSEREELFCDVFAAQLLRLIRKK